MTPETIGLVQHIADGLGALIVLYILARWVL